MGMAKIGNWFRRQDIAYLGIQQRENSVYMIMVAEKEGEDYEIIWQNQITEDIAQEELLEKAEKCYLLSGPVPAGCIFL